MQMTPRKKQLLEYLDAYTRKSGFAPSIPEMAKKFKLANSTVHQHLEELKTAGYLKKEKNRTRGVEVLRAESMVRIPLLGSIAAGAPIEAIESRETIAVPKSRLPRSGEVYALRVQGDSMSDEGVNDGDTILIHKQSTAKNGDTVVALLNGSEATLKTFYKEKGHIRLQPANKNYEPIIFPNGQGISIQGKVLDIIKDISINVTEFHPEWMRIAKAYIKHLV